MTGCPNEHHLGEFVAGRGAPDETLGVELHLAVCDPCREVVSTLARLESPTGQDFAQVGADGEPLRKGSLVDRYLLVDMIGAGAMGAIYVAYDTELDRKIALKILGRSIAASDRSGQARSRLAREAKAMARISHPNVVPVYDAGTFGDEVFVAMELVEGVTLAKWLTREVLDWRSVLARFVEAGEGLAAVHRAGLVHRDFKPENVLVARDGRVRVTDFGLARFERAPTEGTIFDADARPGEISPVTSAAGALLGTPAYMSPEQLEGGEADARSDQFAFCLALFEALVGELPFRARNPVDQLAAIRSQRLPEPAVRSAGLSAMLSVLARGLRLDPSERFPDMESLVAALQRDPTRRRRRTVAVTLSVLIGAGAALGAVQLAQRQRMSCTSEADRRLASVWSPALRTSLREAIQARGAAKASRTGQRIEAAFDAFAAEWRAQRESVCRAADAAPRFRDENLGRWSRCLDQRLAEAKALRELYTGPELVGLDSSSQAFGDLPTLSQCRELGASPPGRSPTTDEIDRDGRAPRLAMVRALTAAGALPRALALVQGIIGDDQHGSAETTLDALLQRGGLERRLQRPGEALATLQRATVLAEEAGDDHARARALVAAVGAIGELPESSARADGYRLAEIAAAVIRRIGMPVRLEAERLTNLATLCIRDGRNVEGKAHYTAALSLLASIATKPSPQRANVQHRMGVLLTELGREEEALPLLREAAVVREELLGAEHPDAVLALLNVGVALDALGRYREAQAELERALSRQRSGAGLENGRAARILFTLAHAVAMQGELARAGELYRQSLTIGERNLAPGDPRRIRPLIGLGELAERTGDADQAVAYFDHALTAAGGGALEPDRLAEAELALARVLRARGHDRDLPRARSLAESARKTGMNRVRP